MFQFLGLQKAHVVKPQPDARSSGHSAFTPLHALAAVLTGLALGLGLALGKPLIVLAAVVGLLAFFWMMQRPELGILLIVLVDSSIIYESAIPILPLGIGSFHGTDLILLGMLFMIFIRQALDRSFAWVSTPMNAALLFFFATVILAALNALFITEVEYKTVMRLVRIFSYYLLFFAVTHFIQTPDKIRFLVRGLFAIAVIVALAMMLQAVLGSNVQIMPGRIETAKTFETKYEATRILPPGQTLIQVLLITAFCLMVTQSGPFLKSGYFYLTLILGVANLLTYNRSTWVTQIMSIGLFTVLVPRAVRKRIMVWTALMVVVGGLSAAVIMNTDTKPAKTLNAMTDRFFSLFTGEKMNESATLKWRRLENYAAKKVIKEEWLFGIGLGNVFAWRKKPISYMHNFYLWTILNLGVIGLAAFAAFYLLFLYRGFALWRSVAEPDLQAVFLSFAIGGMGLIPGAVVNPQFREWCSIIVITTMIGLNESILRNQSAGNRAGVHG